MTLEEMRDAIAANTRPPSQTVLAMFGGKMPTVAELARMENTARRRVDHPEGGSNRTGNNGGINVPINRTEGQTARSEFHHEVHRRRAALICAALAHQPLNTKAVGYATGIPHSSVAKAMERMLDDGLVTCTRHHHGTTWFLEDADT